MHCLERERILGALGWRGGIENFNSSKVGNMHLIKIHQNCIDIKKGEKKYNFDQRKTHIKKVF